MMGLDTNVLVRFLVRDDLGQHRRAVDLLARGPAEGVVFFIGDIVLAELSWVLRSAYGLSRDEIARAVGALLEAEHLEFESADRVRRALDAYGEGRAGFADHLLLERARDAGCESVATFDAALIRSPGVVEP